MIDDRANNLRGGRGEECRRETAARSASLGRELRSLYRHAIQEPVPQEFTELLNKMKAGGEN
ncbi:NepR family anti-sigma factor [Parvibaculum sp.]|uniref:NepR family anti-sigma factor n=1 Tax=Parvibaculum sp. TaxID=2024848 RepID=UPI003BAD6935